MQERHTNRNIYFNELAHTSRKYYLPYIEKFISINETTKILEIGCGEGGNLLPFAEMGCSVVGVDMAASRIQQAKDFFEEKNLSGTFIANDIFQLTNETLNDFDLILIHDVIEHIENKEKFLEKVKEFLKEEGIIFIGFPAWQMPFGGHQQICGNKLISHWPFLHLFPNSIYKFLLQTGKENKNTIDELLSIKKCKMTIENFEKTAQKLHYKIEDRTLYFINPHYETKFKLKPRILSTPFRKVPYFRNYLCSSCFYILK